MTITKTEFKDLLICEPQIFHDDRGYFLETFNKRRFEELTSIKTSFVQDNQSFSQYGVIRGLHFQNGKDAQAKLVRVLDGEVQVVVVDIRRKEPSFGQYFSILLSSKNKKQLYVPRGFAHGFLVLSNTAEYFYKCDNWYNPASEAGIKYDDPYLNIPWHFCERKYLISSKDRGLKSFKELFTI